MTVQCHALILTPRGRDASIAASLLSDVEIASKPVPDLCSLIGALDDDVNMVLVTQEELANADLRDFDAWLKNQPAWSDLPIVVLTHAG